MSKTHLLSLAVIAVIATLIGGCKSGEEVRLQTEFNATRMSGPAPLWDDNNTIRDRVAALCDWLRKPIPEEHMGITAFWCAGGGKRIEAARYAKVERDEIGFFVTASRELEGGGTRTYHPFDLRDPVDLIALCCADMAQAEVERGLNYAREREANDLMSDVESAASHLRLSTSVEHGVRLAASWGIKKLSPTAVEEYLKGEGLDRVFAPGPKPNTSTLEDQRNWTQAKLASTKGNLAELRNQRPSTTGRTMNNYLYAMRTWRDSLASYELEIMELENTLESLSDLETAEKEWKEEAERLVVSRAIAAETLRTIAKDRK